MKKKPFSEQVAIVNNEGSGGDGFATGCEAVACRAVKWNEKSGCALDKTLKGVSRS